jgi:UDP-N-acetylglucosamine 1-carboxyvinyltransferase
MEKIRILGGRPLEGTVRISGAKNAALPDLCAALLTDQPVTLENIPDVRDIRTMGRVLSALGADVSFDVGGVVRVRAGSLSSFEAPYDLVKTMRASVLVLGPLLAREGRARVSLPGGCAIGTRPINLHLQALEKMGAAISVEHGYVEARAEGLRGTEISFETVTVTGTENVLMAACLAEGETVLRNAACEPEVVDLAELLGTMGARIQGAGTATIRIEGARSLHGAAHAVIPDRIETGTFAAACAIAGGEIEIRACHPPHLEALIDKLREAGIRIEAGPDNLRVRSPRRMRPASVSTRPHPGFPTDMQAQYPGERRQRRHRVHLREPLHARGGAAADGRRHPRRRPPRRRLGPHPALGRPAHGHRPPGLGEPGPGRPERGRRDRGRPDLPPGPGLPPDRREAAGSGCRHRADRVSRRPRGRPSAAAP